MLLGSKLLQSAFGYCGKKYDLYGLRATEDEACVIDAVCLAGTKVDVMYLLSAYDIDALAYWATFLQRMDYMTELREARVDQVIYERESKKLDHAWRSF